MRTYLLSTVLLLQGCGTIVVDDVTVMKDDYDRSRDQILRLAVTELPCSREQLTTKVLAVTVHADVKRLAVKGCGKDVVYARKDGSFALESAPPPPR